MSKNFDVAVVGSNILGTTTAYWLSKLDPNLKIALIGGVDIKGTATKAAGAMLGHFGEVTKYTLASAPGRAKFELAHRAAKIWPRWIEQINDELNGEREQLAIRKGTYVIHNATSGQLDTQNFFAMKEALVAYGEPFDEVNPLEIPGLEPVANYRPLGAIYLPNEGFVNPLKILDALTEILSKSKNVSLVNDAVVKIDSGKIKTLSTASGKEAIYAPVVVIAAGAFSQSLIDQIPQIKNRIPRLVSGVGCAVLLENTQTNSAHKLDSVIRTINRAGACGLHVLPRSQNTHYVGATNNVAFSTETDLVTASVNTLLTGALEQLNQHYYAAKIKEQFVGNRPVSLDTFPLIGETSIEGLWLLSGTYREGFHLSSTICKSLAREILQGENLLPKLFSPERRLIETMTKEAAIDEAAMQYVSSGYEHGMKLPNMGWHDTFNEMNRKYVADIYDKLECNFALSPDVVFPYDTDLETHLSLLKKYIGALNSDREPSIDFSKPERSPVYS